MVELNMSPSLRIRRLELEFNRILRAMDSDEVGSKEKIVLAKVHQAFVDGRKYISSYEYSETREEQLDSAKTAKKYLNEARKYILAMSHLLSAIDTANLTAQIDQTIGDLK
jgi:hypothetical protein